MVSPEVADAITVFITMLLGLDLASNSAISSPAPPFMKRQLIRMIRVPPTTWVMS